MRLNSFTTRCSAILLAFCLAAPLDARVQPSHGFDMFSAHDEVQAARRLRTYGSAR